MHNDPRLILGGGTSGSGSVPSTDTQQQQQDINKGKGRVTTTDGASDFLGLATTTSFLHTDLDPLGQIIDSSDSAFIASDPLDAALTTRDSSVRAFTRELRKVIERSDVIIQVLDARDPEGTRSRWVEEEVRKREGEGKRLIAVVNKIDLVPRSVLEAWLKHLRHSFPVLPFKSSTQSQRNNLGASKVPLPQASHGANKGKTTLGGASTSTDTTNKDAFLPALASSLGAPVLIKLLKQYAQSRPHQTLTVGIIGYPNVGKSSLINSLKRSRACAVAAMPGKTRVIQEVALDKGVKILDCPGVVLEDFATSLTGEERGEEGEAERRTRLGEVMLRNCVKVEEIEDPIAPVEAILRRVDPEIIRGIYSIPAYSSVTEFLVAIAFTRGRLGKGGIADLPAAATTVLRDWNAGRIPFYTSPPKIHPSTAPTKVAVVTNFSNADKAVAEGGMSLDVEDGVSGAKVLDGDAILTGLGDAFDLDGLFASGGALTEGQEEWELPVNQEEGGGLPATAAATTDMPIDEDLPVGAVRTSFKARQLEAANNPTQAPPPKSSRERMFTPAELAILEATSGGALDRKSVKQQLKKKAKIAKEKDRREREADEDMFDLADMMSGSMVVAAPKRPERPKKKKQEQKGKLAKGQVLPVTINAEAQKELEFMSFLNSVGGRSSFFFFFSRNYFSVLRDCVK